MGIALLRVDERLIHGQVVIAWGNHLRSRRYVVLDDDLADSDWEQELYGLAVPPNAEARFHKLSEAPEVLDELRSDSTISVVLFRDLAAAVSLPTDAWEEGDALNLGMLHHKAGTSEVRSYLHLDAADRTAVSTLVERGVRVYGRDLPSSSSVSVAELLGHRSTGSRDDRDS
ncbi:MAG: PTS sugar transporter subunit IIB [Gemmatimonadetes bacterium]|nr:PTS sugar transporter subunit IIB [Gemmatimonadota bacterium]NNM34804.1 PTS sugar transporter subunit IIB [Gemmatimonadota bacterium]